MRKLEWVWNNSACLACEVTQCARAVLLGCFQWDGSPQANDHGDAAQLNHTLTRRAAGGYVAQASRASNLETRTFAGDGKMRDIKSKQAATPQGCSRRSRLHNRTGSGTRVALLAISTLASLTSLSKPPAATKSTCISLHTCTSHNSRKTQSCCHAS
jgi:hypothetical protein